MQLFFNDPLEVPDAAAPGDGAGVRAARGDARAHPPLWRKRGYELGFGAGIALGYATCGEVGFEARSDYAAIGAVTNLAASLADEATGGQILIEQRLLAEVEGEVEVEPVARSRSRASSGRSQAFDVLAVCEQAELSAASAS